MDVKGRLKWMQDAKSMLQVDAGQEVCFTQSAQLAYGCPTQHVSRADPLFVDPPNQCELDAQSFLSVYFNADSIEFLSPEELKKRTTLTSRKRGSAETRESLRTHILAVKNALDHHILRLKLVSLRNVFEYTSFMNSCIVNTKMQQLVVRNVTPHIGLMYFARFVDAAETAVMFGLEEPDQDVFGMQVLEDVGMQTADTYIEEWIKILKKNTADIQRKFNDFLRSFLFRVVYTLHCMLLLDPSVRHNDAHLGNWIIDKPSKDASVCNYQTENKTIFGISNQLAVPHLIDFGWASMQTTRAVGLNVGPNHYVDLNKVFNHLHFMLEKHSELIDPQIWKFIESVVPLNYRVGVSKSRQLNFSIWSPHSQYALPTSRKWIPMESQEVGEPLPEFVTPGELLKDPVFDCLHNKTDAHVDFSCLNI
jgi:hypothetical protein